MIEQAWQKRALAIRRERRDLPKQGWHHVEENGFPLWKLHRGGWVGREISEVRIAADGISLWIKTRDARPTSSASATTDTGTP